MHLTHVHDWNVTPTEAVALQNRLRQDVVTDRPLDLGTITHVAGVDVSVKNDVSHAAVVVMTFPDFVPVEISLARRPTPFPYVPGLLSFREGPVLEEAFDKLRHVPDVFIFDGNGIMHPRRIGIASHMGLWLGVPTIGSAKTRLCGRHGLVDAERGASAPLIDRKEIIGVALRSRAGCNPIFVSPGHLSDLDSAVALVMACAPKYRLPEPIRQAHNAAGAFDAAPREPQADLFGPQTN